MSRTEVEKKSHRSELAKAVAFARVEGENEVETATRLLGELARLRKIDERRPPKRKGVPETDVTAGFEDPYWIEDVRKDEALGRLLAKGDPRKVLVGPIDVELETNGTVTIAAVSTRWSALVGTGVSKRSPHDDRNDVTGRKQAVVRAVRDLVTKVNASRARRKEKAKKGLAENKKRRGR